MKLSSKWCIITVFAALLVVAANLPAFADTYHTATFSGGIYGGDANAQPPFQGNGFVQGATSVSGHFVYDDNLIPAPSPLFVNVAFSDFPDIALIPAATAFTINLGTTPLTFTLADGNPGPGQIQYDKSGHFNGFAFVSDFTFLSDLYEFTISGRTWNIVEIASSSQLVSGYLNSGLTNIQSFDPNAAVPLPPTVLLLGSGLVGLVGFRRKFKKS